MSKIVNNKKQAVEKNKLFNITNFLQIIKKM
ncbi:hypothetical protein ACUXD1_002232 [Staphylococcus epidermidis]